MSKRAPLISGLVGVLLAADSSDAAVRENIIQGNLVFHNQANGIYLSAGTNHNRVLKNEVETNHESGIAVAGADNLIQRNQVHDNDAFDLEDTGQGNRWPNNTVSTANW
jgi:parallel beta-helix repeat protein